jgi:polysaccharide biosynthesis protein PslH
MNKSLLVISNKIPYPPDGGDTSRLFNFIQYLAYEWQIDLIAYERFEKHTRVDARTDFDNPLKSICRTINSLKLPNMTPTRWKRYFGLMANTLPSPSFAYFSPWMRDAITTSLCNGNYRAVLVSSLPMAQFVPAGALGGSSIYDQVDAYHPLHKEALRWVSKKARIYTYLDALKVKHYEKSILCGHFGKNLVVTEHDAAALRKLSPRVKVDVVPCGVDTSYFSPISGEIPNRLIFTGTMRYGPNIDAMIYFCNEILPLIADQIPDIKLYIVGHSVDSKIQDLTSDRVVVTGRVPDIRPYLASGAVVIAPFRLGSGMHVKNLEAMAMERAIVATSRGIQGINAQSGRELLVSDDPGGFADGVIRLLRDSELRRVLGQAGRRLVLQRYSKECVGQQMNELLLQVS